MIRSAALSEPGRPDSGNNPDCNTQFTATFGGNPDLKPEKANQTTVGVVWEPLNGVSLGVDWFYMDLKDIVTNGVPIATILTPRTYSLYSSLVTRAATCAGGPPCPITAIDAELRQHRQGKDPGYRRRCPLHDAVDGVSAASVPSLTGTYYIKYEVSSNRTAASRASCPTRTQAPNTGITPRWKSYAALIVGLRPVDGDAGQQLS